MKKVTITRAYQLRRQFASANACLWKDSRTARRARRRNLVRSAINFDVSEVTVAVSDLIADNAEFSFQVDGDGSINYEIAPLHASYPQKALVGGFWTPINKFELLTPWISLTLLITVMATSTVYEKRRKKQQDKSPRLKQDAECFHTSRLKHARGFFDSAISLSTSKSPASISTHLSNFSNTPSYV